MGRSVGPPSFLGERDSTRRSTGLPALYFFFLSSIVSECAVYPPFPSSPARSVALRPLSPRIVNFGTRGSSRYTLDVDVFKAHRSCTFFNVIKLNVWLFSSFGSFLRRLFSVFHSVHKRIGRSCQILQSFTFQVSYFPLHPHCCCICLIFFLYILFHTASFISNFFPSFR